MQTLSATEDQLRLIIREEIANSLKKEFMKMRLMLIPEISKKEQNEIENLYGKPTFEIAESMEIDV